MAPKVKDFFSQDLVRWLITIGTILVSATLSWASVKTDIAVINQRLTTIENNHLVHIQSSLDLHDQAIRTIQITMAKIQEKLGI